MSHERIQPECLQFLDNVFDTFNKYLCLDVHQHWELFVFPTTVFFNSVSSANSREDRDREGDEGGREGSGRWMHWGVKEGEGRNQGRYK